MYTYSTDLTTRTPTTPIPQPGYFGPKEDPSRRLAWALMYYKERPEDNTYARPMEGVRVVVDLLKQCVVLCFD